MMENWIEITAEDGAFEAFVARPDTTEPVPAVVVVQEIFGVNEDLRTTCREVASHGFVALSPDLFWRSEPRIEMNRLDEAEWQRAFGLYKSFDLDRGVRDVAAAVAAARTLPGVTGKVAVMGFCLGGLITYLTAARTDVNAAAAYYGGSTEKHLGEAGKLTHPLLMHLAGEDEYMSKEAQAEIVAALAGNDLAEVNIYPGCNHAFARHSGDHYDAAAAALANERTFGFLERTLR